MLICCEIMMTSFINTLLKEFDEAVTEKDLNKIAEIMETINVELV